MLPDGYKFQYTWWMDFTIADAFGIKAIKDTYNRAFKEWHENRVAMQELTAVLNWKGWRFYDQDNESPIAKLYFKLYQECYDKCLNHFKGKELTAYWEFLDQYNIINQLSQLMVTVGLSAHGLFICHRTLVRSFCLQSPALSHSLHHCMKLMV